MIDPVDLEAARLTLVAIEFDLSRVAPGLGLAYAENTDLALEAGLREALERLETARASCIVLGDRLGRP